MLIYVKALGVLLKPQNDLVKEQFELIQNDLVKEQFELIRIESNVLGTHRLIKSEVLCHDKWTTP